MLKYILLLFGGGYAALHWEEIKAKFENFLLETVNFRALEPSNFRFDGNRILFDFNFEFNNPTPAPIPVQSFDIKVLKKKNNGSGEFELLTENTDKTKSVVLQPGINRQTLQFDLQTTDSIETALNTLTDYVISGNEQLFRIEAVMTILDQIDPITTVIDFRPFSQLSGLKGIFDEGGFSDFLDNLGQNLDQAAQIIDTGTSIINRGEDVINTVTGRDDGSDSQPYVPPPPGPQASTAGKLMLYGGGAVALYWLVSMFLKNQQPATSKAA